MEMLNKSPEITRLVSHSLGSAVVNKINEEQPNKFATTTYATPTIKKKGREHKTHADWIIEILTMLLVFWMDTLKHQGLVIGTRYSA